MTTEHERVNHPSHYHPGKHEVIDVLEEWGLGFHLGNTVKYIARHEQKGSPLEDLMKARWYLDRAIALIERSMSPKETNGHQTPDVGPGTSNGAKVSP